MSPERTAKLKILHVSPEAVPFSKIGGLGDVAGSLPPALRKLGADCRLLTPAWPGVLDTARDRGFNYRIRKDEGAIRWKIFRRQPGKFGHGVSYLLKSLLFGGTVPGRTPRFGNAQAFLCF